jgi:hypothetical protein
MLWLSCNLSTYRQTPLALWDPEGMILWSYGFGNLQTSLALQGREGMIVWSCNWTLYRHHWHYSIQRGM